MLWAVVIIVVAAAVIAWALILPGGDKRVGSNSTPAPPSSSSTTSTTTKAAATASTASTQTTIARTYTAQLSGGDQVPALSTPASGTFTLTVTPEDSSVHYVLKVREITNATIARLRAGKAGTTGALLLTIYAGPTKSGVFSGTLTQGSFTAAKLEGPLKGKSVADLEALAKAGSVYLNVGTSAHPKGEIRGQLK